MVKAISIPCEIYGIISNDYFSFFSSFTYGRTDKLTWPDAPVHILTVQYMEKQRLTRKREIEELPEYRFSAPCRCLDFLKLPDSYYAAIKYLFEINLKGGENTDCYSVWLCIYIRPPVKAIRS